MSPPNKISDIINQSTPATQPVRSPPGGGGTPAAPPPPGESKFNAANIENFGGKLIVNVGGHIKQARLNLNASPRNVEASSFTTFCAHLAHAYIQATEYADVDLITKEKNLVEFDQKLKATAQILREAERKSTVKPT